jgi:hypothetical protein
MLHPLVKGKAVSLVLAPKWSLAWEGRSEFYELSYRIQFCSKGLKYPTRYLCKMKFLNFNFREEK